jgi:hypothetical protein
MSMRLYNQANAFYAGVDLHARTMFTHVLGQRGLAMLFGAARVLP